MFVLGSNQIEKQKYRMEPPVISGRNFITMKRRTRFRMTIRNCAKGTNQADHTRFGGKIYLSDFNTDHRGKENRKSSPIAARIAADWKFDENCRNNQLLNEHTC